jgi:CRP/FNR family transcriptional regulator
MAMAIRQQANEGATPSVAAGTTSVCAQCGFKPHCMPDTLSRADREHFDALIGAPRTLKRGARLYWNGEPFKSVFIVRNGLFKTSTTTREGREQVTGFQMAGDMLGIDGISNAVHVGDAVALDDSQVCAIPFGELEALASRLPAVQRHLHQLMGREIVRDHGVMLLLGAMSADARLIAFLLNLSQRFALRGYSATEFHLRMTREEIGSYLGLKLETISRVFSRLQSEGLIAVNLKHIRIMDLDQFRKAMKGACVRRTRDLSPLQLAPA